jgi:hypothetical protein
MRRFALAGSLALLASNLAAATFTVSNTNDSGAGSLRQAIDDANTNPGADTIAFAIPGAGVHTITPLSLLPIINSPMLVDGYTQPGSSVNTNASGALNSVLQIEIDGTSAPNRCITILGSDVTVRGLVVNRCDDAIQLGTGATGIVIAGNFLGTDPSGLAASANHVGVDIAFPQGGSITVTIGGPDPADRNLISGSTNSGILAFSNFNGTSTSTIFGNIIGLGKDGATAIPNNVGISMDGIGPTFSTIGGVFAGGGNLIAGNTGPGIWIIHPADTVTIRGNAIYENGGLGIKLGNASGIFPFPNDADDSDGGPNELQNFPILSGVQAVTAPTGDSTHIQGILHSTPSTTFDIDFYENPACSNFPREFIEGKTYIGSGQTTTNASGTGVIDVTLPVTVEPGARISATATDPSGRTSEFSQRIPFSMQPNSGDAAGGTVLTLTGTDMLDGATVTVGGVAATDVNVSSFQTLSATAPALGAGTVHDVVVTNTDGSTGTLVKAYVADFLDVPLVHQFHSFVTTLVSNAITVGIGGGLYGVDQGTKRQQMAVFLLKAEHGLCYTPPPCAGAFPDVPCLSTFANWIEALAAEGITTGCGGGLFCPENLVTRRQMAVFLLKTKYGSGYVPPACTGVFDDVPCPGAPAVDFIERLAAEQITGGCSASPPLYCPDGTSTRGQMAVFITKTFNLQ